MSPTDPRSNIMVYRFMWDSFELTGVTLLVYARVFCHCRDSGKCFCESRADTARYLGVTERAVTRAIGTLTKGGLLIESKAGNGPKGRCTRSYRVDVSKVAMALGA